MSNEFSLAKSGGLGKTPWVNAKMSTTTPTRHVEDRLHEERRRDRRIARSGDRGAREEQLDDVAAARRHDVVEADRREVGAPDPPPLEADRRIGGAQAVEERARAQGQVEPEEGQPQQQQPPVDRLEVREELPDGVEERAEALAERGRCEQRVHDLKRTVAGAARRAPRRSSWPGDAIQQGRCQHAPAHPRSSPSPSPARPARSARRCSRRSSAHARWGGYWAWRAGHSTPRRRGWKKVSYRRGDVLDRRRGRRIW